MKIQVSIEYLLVTSFFLTLIIIVFPFVYSQFQSAQKEYYFSLIEENINKISSLSEIIYSQGYPAKVSIELNFPKITNLTCSNNKIYYEYENRKSFVSGNYNVSCSLTLYGISKIIIESNINGYVEIKI